MAGAAGHQLAVVAYRDGQLYNACKPEDGRSRGEVEEEEDEEEGRKEAVGQGKIIPPPQ